MLPRKTEKTEYVISLGILVPSIRITGPDYDTSENAELTFSKLSDAIEMALNIMASLNVDTGPLMRKLIHKDAILFSVSRTITRRITEVSEVAIASVSLPKGK